MAVTAVAVNDPDTTMTPIGSWSFNEAVTDVLPLLLMMML
jgi:hypothetical protein